MKRSRSIYIYWSVALAVLIGAGLFCWAVVVPVWQVRRALARQSYNLNVRRIEEGAWRIGMRGGWGRAVGDPPIADPIEVLGGPEAAAGKLHTYLMFPRVGAKRKEAVYQLSRCGPPATETLISLLDDQDVEIRRWAAWALGELGPGANGAEEALRRFFEDSDEATRMVAQQAVAKLYYPGLGESGRWHPKMLKPILENGTYSTDDTHD